MEQRRDAYVAALRGRPEAMDLAVRDAEREIFEMAVIARRERIAEGVLDFVLAGLEIGGGVVLLASTDDPNLHWLAGGLFAASAGSVVTGVARLAVRSEEERIAGLWRQERSSPPPPAERTLRISPLIGVGAIGIGGTF
jgi:hypothetical protein